MPELGKHTVKLSQPQWKISGAGKVLVNMYGDIRACSRNCADPFGAESMRNAACLITTGRKPEDTGGHRPAAGGTKV
jgi:hypothetical protein